MTSPDHRRVALHVDARDPVLAEHALSVMRNASRTLAKGSDAQYDMAQVELICPGNAARRRNHPDAVNISLALTKPFPTQTASLLHIARTGAHVNKGATLATLQIHRRTDGHATFMEGSDHAASRLTATQMLECAIAGLECATRGDRRNEAAALHDRTAVVAQALAFMSLDAHPGAVACRTIAPGPSGPARIIAHYSRVAATNAVVVAGPDEIGRFFVGMPPVERVSLTKGIQTTGYVQPDDEGPADVQILPVAAIARTGADPISVIRLLRTAGIDTPRFHAPVPAEEWRP